MDLLGLFLLASLIGAAMVALVIVWSTNRASSAAITSHFKASEHILDTGQPPPDWLMSPLWKRLLARPAPPDRDALLQRLDKLIRYFESSSFVEDEWTRQQLLAQLGAVRERWQSLQLENRPHV